jgi:hypothetical protein
MHVATHRDHNLGLFRGVHMDYRLVDLAMTGTGRSGAPDRANTNRFSTVPRFATIV